MKLEAANNDSPFFELLRIVCEIASAKCETKMTPQLQQGPIFTLENSSEQVSASNFLSVAEKLAKHAKFSYLCFKPDETINQNELASLLQVCQSILDTVYGRNSSSQIATYKKNVELAEATMRKWETRLDYRTWFFN